MLIFLWLILIFCCAGLIGYLSLKFDDIYNFSNATLKHIVCTSDQNIYTITFGQEINCWNNAANQNELNVYMYVSSKIILIASIAIIIFFSIKNFNTNKYNQITNLYKADLLKSLPAIFTQFPDAERGIFFGKLADFLFKNHDTGMNKNTDPGMPYEKVLDLLSKAIGKSKEGG